MIDAGRYLKGHIFIRDPVRAPWKQIYEFYTLDGKIFNVLLIRRLFRGANIRGPVNQSASYSLATAEC
ncbi:hypothetical protein RSal33209_1983 [Renibacterium salmoninarum ATCC 33209]|uniref:Uncharacterized protein n=1 Tax=Renibacterium salmoninarum (strain ATCC 33209 / DSM 20767 / JCM 11484 / NBRC 15589 / NCIMB 2235) TaxID=288705 RepID=A9WSC8_RENSM|nr:hypothetical protein RSal33209_1983 [Renibacterium salmoninarum ATCC 33209]